MDLALIGIAGAVIITIATFVFNAWLYEKDEGIGAFFILVSVMVAICALATITDICLYG